jgi:hypothetical protein
MLDSCFVRRLHSLLTRKEVQFELINGEIQLFGHEGDAGGRGGDNRRQMLDHFKGASGER